MNDFIEKNLSLEKCPALVLNADYRTELLSIIIMVMARYC